MPGYNPLHFLKTVLPSVVCTVWLAALPVNQGSHEIAFAASHRVANIATLSPLSVLLEQPSISTIPTTFITNSTPSLPASLHPPAFAVISLKPAYAAVTTPMNGSASVGHTITSTSKGVDSPTSPIAAPLEFFEGTGAIWKHGRAYAIAALLWLSTLWTIAQILTAGPKATIQKLSVGADVSEWIVKAMVDSSIDEAFTLLIQSSLPPGPGSSFYHGLQTAYANIACTLYIAAELELLNESSHDYYIVSFALLIGFLGFLRGIGLRSPSLVTIGNYIFGASGTSAKHLEDSDDITFIGRVPTGLAYEDSSDLDTNDEDTSRAQRVKQRALAFRFVTLNSKSRASSFTKARSSFKKTRVVTYDADMESDDEVFDASILKNITPLKNTIRKEDPSEKNSLALDDNSAEPSPLKSEHGSSRIHPSTQALLDKLREDKRNRYSECPSGSSPTLPNNGSGSPDTIPETVQAQLSPPPIVQATLNRSLTRSTPIKSYPSENLFGPLAPKDGEAMNNEKQKYLLPPARTPQHVRFHLGNGMTITPSPSPGNLSDASSLPRINIISSPGKGSSNP